MRIKDFTLERYFARWEFTAPYLLCSSDTESFAMAELIEMADDDARARWAGLRLGYTEAPGLPALREAISSLYEKIAADEIIVFAGAEEAIFAFAQSAFQPGDHVVALWPAYQSLHEAARAAGADVEPLRLRYEDGWRLDLELLTSMLRPSTRAIIVNFPHNPTGMLPSRAEFDALAKLCASRGITLFCDEVYRFGEFDEADRLENAADAFEGGVSLGGLAKPFGLAGLRIGWIATRDVRLRARIASFKDYLTICSSAPSEILALVALRAKVRVLGRNRAIVATNLAKLDEFFARHSQLVEWVRPRAGSIGFPRLLTGEPVDAFAERCVTQTGVLILPGSIFDHAGDHFRIGFGRKNMPEVLDRFEAFLT